MLRIKFNNGAKVYERSKRLSRRREKSGKLEGEFFRIKPKKKNSRVVEWKEIKKTYTDALDKEYKDLPKILNNFYNRDFPIRFMQKDEFELLTADEKERNANKKLIFNYSKTADMFTFPKLSKYIYWHLFIEISEALVKVYNTFSNPLNSQWGTFKAENSDMATLLGAVILDIPKSTTPPAETIIDTLKQRLPKGLSMTSAHEEFINSYIPLLSNRYNYRIDAQHCHDLTVSFMQNHFGEKTAAAIFKGIFSQKTSDLLRKWGLNCKEKHRTEMYKKHLEEHCTLPSPKI